MVKSSKPLGLGISNFPFQILLDSTSQFLDSVYISLELDDSSFSAWNYAFVEKSRFCRDLGDSPKTLRKLCVVFQQNFQSEITLFHAKDL